MRTAAREAGALTLRGLTKRFDDQHLAVSDMNLHVEPGEMIALLGPSGCGKTTTLRMIAGFLTASSGDILLDGTSILNVPAYRRDMGIVFQSYALFPHLTVTKNVRFGLEMRRIPAADAAVASTRCCASSSSTPSPSACRATFRGGSSVSRWRALSRFIRACCCSTSLCRTSTQRYARTWRAKSASCSATAVSPRSSSPTIRARQWRWPIGLS